MKTFREVVEEYQNRMNAVVSPVPDIPFDEDAELNDEQKDALEILRSGQNCFLTGPGGTGKTFLLRKFISEAGGKNVLVTAPTGKAATRVKGRTLHCVFSIPCCEDGDGILKPQDCVFDDARWAVMTQVGKHKRKYERIHSCNTLIIDEISMVRADVFKWVVEFLRTEERRTGHHVQIICCGDFAQIAPVICTEDKEAWLNLYPDNPEGFVFLSQEWRDLQIRTIELKRIERQKNLEDAKALERIRRGDPDGEGIAWIKAHCAKAPFPNVCTICGTRAEVDSINQTELDWLKGDPVVFETFIPDPSKLNEKKMQVGRELCLKPGAPVMTVVNDSEGRFHNGSRGVVVSIDPNKDVVRVRMDDSGEEVDIEPYQWKTYTQFPLTLAWALTYHRAQGSTFEAVNLSVRRVWDAGQLYCALSRCTEVRKMFIDGDLSRLHFEPNPAVVAFYERELRKANQAGAKAASAAVLASEHE